VLRTVIRQPADAILAMHGNSVEYALRNGAESISANQTCVPHVVMA
jgi:hypothetical protein